jgi:cytochrome c1
MIRALALLSMACALGALACRSGTDVPGYLVRLDGSPSRGKTLIAERHCGACHDIPDVVGASGVIGPALGGYAQRSFIAGGVPNTAANAVVWIRAPQKLEPSTAMPALGLNEGEANDVAAYLFTLR